jgi:hypothetical protein
MNLFHPHFLFHTADIGLKCSKAAVIIREYSMRLAAVLGLFAFAGSARAQSAHPACADSTVFFEFQVTTHARWIADSALVVHPTPTVKNPANLVQFVVDTAGVPAPATLRVLKRTDAAVIAEARASMSTWRYRPAILNGCPVRQLVQTPIGP